MRGYAWEDYYLAIPKVGLFFRSANNQRYGLYMVEMFMNGAFVGAAKMYKRKKIEELYNAGHLSDAREYARGYRMWRETELGGNKIIAAKERARISHAMCDLPGAHGHEIRQAIRRRLA